MSMMVSFVLSFFPRDVLDEILNLIESVSEDFPSYSLTSLDDPDPRRLLLQWFKILSLLFVRNPSMNHYRKRTNHG